eukprot:TRINITY_DN1495_c1_g2_i2.p2 TRINITY_DN1495_c1_g2~~TRINITY_DN1495_c1_g2_i2.p2  ORF type:complete len:325 (+),score=26.82 TRINITY_DN1495_c1_g2_i2:55-975(+)
MLSCGGSSSLLTKNLQSCCIKSGLWTGLVSVAGIRLWTETVILVAPQQSVFESVPSMNILQLPQIPGQQRSYSSLRQKLDMYNNDQVSQYRDLYRSQKRWIQTQGTPNPSSLMFLPHKQVMESGTYDFVDANDGSKSPLATALFQIEGVTRVFFGSDFVTITKDDDAEWENIKPKVRAAIENYYKGADPLFYDESHIRASSLEEHEDDDQVVSLIKELLLTRIRPAVQEDGGDIEFVSFDHDSGIVSLKMQGSCSGCPSSSVTLKNGIENMLMHYIPEVKQVEQVFDEYEVEGIKEFGKLESQLSN